MKGLKMTDYYEQKQKENEEMADLLAYFVAVFAVLAVVWAVIEVFKFFSKI